MLLNTHVELDELGWMRRQTIHTRPIAYRENGALKRSVHDWADGDANFPHVVARAPMMVYTAGNGMRRICPTRDQQRYVEIGAPYIKPAASWNRVNLGTPTRSGNTLTWTVANARVNVVMGGHMIDLSCEFLNGWQPPNGQIAFPVGMNGLTRTGSEFFADGAKVLTLRPFSMYDAANPMDTRAVDTQLVKVGAQWYALATLPSLVGMARPVLDPTLTLQPDAAAGVETKVSQGGGDTNYGTDSLLYMRTGGSADMRSLVKFDLSGLPVGAVVSAATLSLYNRLIPTSTVGSVWRILAANSAWTEAEATWNHTVGASHWAGDAGGDHGADAGCSVSGTDYSATLMGSWAWTNGDADGLEYPIALNLAEFALMVAGNYGFLLTGAANNNNAVYSSDWGLAGIRPKLVVEYTLPTSGRKRFPRR